MLGANQAVCGDICTDAGYGSEAIDQDVDGVAVPIRNKALVIFIDI